MGVIASWVNTSDENGALQFLPNDGAPNGLYDVPGLYVGNSTGEVIRDLIRKNEVDTATVVLDAPSYIAPSQTVLGHLVGTSGTNSTIIVYTHSGCHEVSPLPKVSNQILRRWTFHHRRKWYLYS